MTLDDGKATVGPGAYHSAIKWFCSGTPKFTQSTRKTFCDEAMKRSRSLPGSADYQPDFKIPKLRIVGE